MKQWKFKPFREGDTPVTVATDVELDFPGDFPGGTAEKESAVRDRQVHVARMYSYLDKTGKMVLPLQYSGADNFSEGLARVEIGGKSGYIDKTGKMVIPPIYDAASEFLTGWLPCGWSAEDMGTSTGPGKWLSRHSMTWPNTLPKGWQTLR